MFEGIKPTTEQMLQDLRCGTTNKEVHPDSKLMTEILELYHRFRMQKVLHPISQKRLEQIYKEHMR